MIVLSNKTKGTWRMLSFIKTGVLFLLLLASSQLLAAQLINQIPASLEHNWRYCLNYAAITPDCEEIRLPQTVETIHSSVISQTYQKEFVISSELKSTPLGIWFRHIDDVDRVLINGIQIGQSGQFPAGFESSFRRQRVYFIPSELLKYNQFNQLTVQVFSSRSRTGIQSEPPKLANFLELKKQIDKSDYVYIVIVAMLILLTLFPTFYITVLKSDNESFFFIAFLVSLAMVSLARSQIPIHAMLDLSSVFKLEVFMINVSVLSISIYLFSFFDLEIRQPYKIGLYAIGLAGLLLIIWPNAQQLRLIAEINLWLLVIFNFLVAGSALIIALHKQRRYAWIITAISTACWITLLYDALMMSSGVIGLNLNQYPEFLPVVGGLASVIFTLTLTHKYWHYFKGSTYDQLTGTLLRPAFFQRLSEEMQRCNRSGEQLLVAVIDIQQAKRISINYGYSIGNHLLTTVSHSLTKVTRPYDLICRFSDDQFCVAAPLAKEEFAEKHLQRIYEEFMTIQQPINKDIELYIDAKIGAVMYNHELHMSVSHIIQDANYSLSKAENSTENFYLLTQKVNQRS